MKEQLRIKQEEELKAKLDAEIKNRMALSMQSSADKAKLEKEMQA